MDTQKRNRRIADAYYNLGLEKAGQRDLTGAAMALKKSLRFDKYQTDARNLLGLIYNETGEVGSALTQWVISLNLQEKNNLAEEYLRRVHEDKGYLELADQSAKKFNQALGHAVNNNEDLAVLMLSRMLEDFPQYVKAQELLALLYIQREDYTKAGRCLYQALKVDHYNPQAQRYMDVAKKHTGKAEVEKRKLKNAFSHRQMQDDDIIIPPSYKETTGLQSVLNILVGLVLGAMVIFFLVMPAKTEALNASHNQETQKILEQLNQKNLEVDDLNSQLDTANAEKQKAEDSLQTIVSSNDGILSQYQRLVQILQAYRDNDMKTAAQLYSDTDFSVMNDDASVRNTISWIQTDMGEKAWKILEELGDEAVSQDPASQQALVYYQKSLMIKGDNPSALYKLGSVYQAQGDMNSANTYYGDVILNFPNSEYAREAQRQRGY